MNELRDIYQILKNEGFCATQEQFSRHWLGRSPHYMSQTRGHARNASLTSLQLVTAKLEIVAERAKADAPIETARILGRALIFAKVMCLGEYELRCVPPWYRVTAV